MKKRGVLVEPLQVVKRKKQKKGKGVGVKEEVKVVTVIERGGDKRSIKRKHLAEYEVDVDRMWKAAKKSAVEKGIAQYR